LWHPFVFYRCNRDFRCVVRHELEYKTAFAEGRFLCPWVRKSTWRLAPHNRSSLPVCRGRPARPPVETVSLPTQPDRPKSCLNTVFIVTGRIPPRASPGTVLRIYTPFPRGCAIHFTAYLSASSSSYSLHADLWCWLNGTRDKGNRGIAFLGLAPRAGIACPGDKWTNPLFRSRIGSDLGCCRRPSSPAAGGRSGDHHTGQELPIEAPSHVLLTDQDIEIATFRQ